MSCKRLIYGVIDNFVYQVMQSSDRGGTDIHAGALSDGLQTLQYLDLCFIVMIILMILLHVFAHIFTSYRIFAICFFIVNISNEDNAFAKLSDVVIPGKSWVEKSGTFTNCEGLEQCFNISAEIENDNLSEREIFEKLA